MAEPVVCAEKLGKRYTLRHQTAERYTTLREVASRNFKKLLHPAASKVSREDFWALTDVSFEAQAGEKIGIIGRNGAGKSTLLKILSRITEPTHGRVTLRGRVASLLEVGTGFHPELSGRENIFLNGAILGLRRQEIYARFDAIVDFSGVENFIDTPVKRYSSGMSMRLAFAVAAHLRPEILIVDEVLAVGDAAFQSKCLSRIEDLAAQDQTTVLFVSHNMNALLRLCQRGILLDQGSVQGDGAIKDVVARYYSAFASSNLEQDCTTLPRAAHLRGGYLLHSVSMKANSAGVPFGEALVFQTLIEWRSGTSELAICWAIFSASGDEIASARVDTRDLPEQRATIQFRVPHLRLAPGRYSVSFGLKSHAGDEDFVERALMFDVLPNEQSSTAWADTIRAHTIPLTELLTIQAA
jgi:lipopolysaccharide transport system ATP-binding protein